MISKERKPIVSINAYREQLEKKKESPDTPSGDFMERVRKLAMSVEEYKKAIEEAQEALREAEEELDDLY